MESEDKETSSEKKFKKKTRGSEAGRDFPSLSVRLHPDDEKILIRRVQTLFIVQTNFERECYDLDASVMLSGSCEWDDK